MDRFGHPRVVVGVDDSLSGLAAVRTAVAEARLRHLPLYAVRSRTTGLACVDSGTMTTALLSALGVLPADVEIEQTVSVLPVREALCTAAADPRDLIVVGVSGNGQWRAFWSGSVARSVARRARCPVMAVPAPEMSRTMHRHRRPDLNQ